MKKNILVVSAFLPISEASAGARTSKTYLSALSKQHTVHIISFFSTVEKKHLDKFTFWCFENNIFIWHIRKVNKLSRLLNAVIFFFLPAIMVTRFSFRSLVTVFINRHKFNTIFVDYSQGIFFGWVIAKFLRKKLIVSSPDIMLQSFERAKQYGNIFRKLFYYTEYVKIKIFEPIFLNSASLVIVQSHKDKDLLCNSLKINMSKIEVISPEYLRLSSDKRDKINNPRKRVLLWGAFNRKENEQAFHFYVREIHPLILGKVQNYSFHAVGAEPSNRMLKIAEKDDSVWVEGYVENPASMFDTMSVAAVPLLEGAGIKVKTLESLYFGLPTVSTDIGAEGIEGISGLYVENDPKDFAEKIINLLTSPRDLNLDNSVPQLETKYSISNDLQRVSRRISKL